MARTRTNIEIENVYVHAVMDRYGVRTKTEAVDLALPHLAGTSACLDRVAQVVGIELAEASPHA